MHSRLPTYRGWTMVAVAFVSLALVFGASGATLPLIYGVVAEEHGWSRTEAVLLFTYKSFASAAAALFIVGPLLRRYGLRFVMVVSFATAAIGMSAFIAVDSIPAYYLAGTILGLGSATSMTGANLLVSRWFQRNQGLAIGIALTGTSTGGALFPLIAAPLIEHIGWRGTIASLSMVIWLIVLPLYLWKAREDPSPTELAPELGGARGERAQVAAEASAIEVMRTASFWKLGGALLIVAVVDTAVLQHTPLILMSEAGVGSGLAAATLSLIFAFGIVGKILAGMFYDRRSFKGVSLWCIYLGASTALALSVAPGIMLVAFAVLRGVAHGGLIPCPAVLAQHGYGPRMMNAALPVFMGIWLLGAGIGPAVLAMFFDAQGHYRYGLTLFVALTAVAGLLIAGARPRRGHAALRAGHRSASGTT